MDYRRVYWALFVGIGLTFALQYVPAVLAGDRSLTVAVGTLGAVVVTAVGLLALARPDEAGGPDEPNLLFAIVLLAFLLELAATLFL